MKKVLSLVLVFALSLASCGAGSGAEGAVNSFFKALKAADYDKASGYLDTSDGWNLKAEDPQEAELAKMVYSELSYSIKEAKEDGDTATVKVEVTAPDMSAALQNYMSDLMGGKIDITDEAKAQNAMYDYLKKVETTKTSTVDLTLKKTDDNWKIQSNEVLVDAVTGGMISALSNMMGGLTE